MFDNHGASHLNFQGGTGSVDDAAFVALVNVTDKNAEKGVTITNTDTTHSLLIRVDEYSGVYTLPAGKSVDFPLREVNKIRVKCATAAQTTDYTWTAA